MEVLFADQWHGFLLACIVGIGLALVYDLFRLLRIFLALRKKFVFFLDLIFMALSAIVTFLLALATNDGILRFYLLAGEGVGMCAYFLTVGEVTVRLAQGILAVIQAITTFLRRKILSPIKGKLQRGKEKFRCRLKVKRFMRQKKKNMQKGLENDQGAIV